MPKMEKICNQCNKRYKPWRKTAKFCSHRCHSDSLKGALNLKLQEGRAKIKGINHPFFGKHLTTAHRLKISLNHADVSEEKNPGWKGEEGGYVVKHKWIYKKLGQPQKCDKCGTTTYPKYEWANRSRKYKRVISDWIRLCIPCHRKADYHGTVL